MPASPSVIKLDRCHSQMRSSPLVMTQNQFTMGPGMSDPTGACCEVGPSTGEPVTVSSTLEGTGHVRTRVTSRKAAPHMDP